VENEKDRRGRENERLAVRGRVPSVGHEENANAGEKGEMRSHKGNGRKTT